MAEAEAEASNPLVTTTAGTDTSPQIQLHPLVLLTISDYLTRHTLRQQNGPVVGAIIGQQTGRDVTMEVAFECKTTALADGRIVFDEVWFLDRLEQFKDTHKAPALDLTGWFTIGDPSGPKPAHVPIHHQLQQRFGYESACLLLFHPHETTTGGKLPLTLYEGAVVGENAVEMDTADILTNLKFRKLSYSVETGEAEMISVDFVAKGGGNATAVEMKEPKKEKAEDEKGKGKLKPASEKGKETAGEAAGANGAADSYLSAEDDEMISSLTAKANAVKMLHTRIDLIQSYLSSLPPSYLTDASLPISTDTSAGESPNHQILRFILALQARIPLLVPPDTAAFTRESLEQNSDTALIQLLSSITSGVCEAGEMGRKYSVVENARMSARMNERRGGRAMDLRDLDGGDFGNVAFDPMNV